MAREPGTTADEARVAAGYELVPDELWKGELARLPLAECAARFAPTPLRQERCAAGRAVRTLRGKAPAREVARAAVDSLRRRSS